MCCFIEEINAPKTNEGFRKLPQIRIRDKAELAHKQVRVRCYSDYLTDKEFADAKDAAIEIIEILRKIAKV